MPWTMKQYPLSMKHLTPKTRKKAIEIANALLEDHVEERIAIATGIKNAKAWAIKRRVL